MMLEVLFAHQHQEQTFLSLLACGLALGLMLHIGTLLRRRFLRTLWDVFTALAVAILVLLVILRQHDGLRAYGVLGLVLGALLYLAGFSQILQAGVNLFQKYKNSRPPKAGNTPPDDETNVQME